MHRSIIIVQAGLFLQHDWKQWNKRHKFVETMSNVAHIIYQHLSFTLWDAMQHVTLWLEKDERGFHGRVTHIYTIAMTSCHMDELYIPRVNDNYRQRGHHKPNLNDSES